MGLIAFLIVGGIAGWLASTFMNKSQGILMNIVVGIVGAAIGLSATGFVGSIVMATIGAVILLWILGKVRP